MKPEETIDFPIRWAWHRIARLYNTEASKHGGSMALGYVLLNIDFENGTPSTKLGPQMGMEPRSLTRTLKSMEKKGLIYREPDKKDKRMVRILLTESGKQMREISKTTVIQFNESIQSKISKKKLDTFFDTMNEINSILETESIFDEPKVVS
ncbi:MAG: MarR family transcriptional regulator [Flavobacteriales bacterium]|nr:MarR family transcriptional regulator [Flavobacteriales bacterium]